MSHKRLATIALIMVFVFGGLVVLYPRIFTSDRPPITTPAPENIPPGPSPVR